MDFYAPKAKIVVEVDGSQHMESEQAARDLQRDTFLASRGVRVFHFDDIQVLKEIEGVMGVIFRAVSESLEANPPLRDLRLLSRTPGARRRVELTLPSRAHGVVLVRDWHEEPGDMPVEVPE